MAKQPNTRLVGVFIISGLAVFLIILALFLQSKVISDNKNLVVMYFEESINGLNVGSPVVFKGVEVGKVVKIDLIANPQNLDFSIPVYARMNPRQESFANSSFGAKRELLNELIKKGLRARLTSQSYLTGQLMIEFEMLPNAPIVLKQEAGKEKYFEVPTTLSPLGEISKGMQSLPVRDGIEKFNLMMDEMSRQIPVVMPQITKTLKDIDKVVVNNTAVSTEALNNFNRAMQSINEAAKAVRNFADYVERHPESLLKGKKGGE